MPEYRLSLDFTAADDAQAARLALAWADTCAAEYGTRFAGFERIDLTRPRQRPEWIAKCYPDFRVPCPTCGSPPGVGCVDPTDGASHTKHPSRRAAPTSGSYVRPTEGSAGGV